MALSSNVLQRQPSNLDYARPTQFRFDILKVPNVQYFTTEVNLPGIAFSGDAIMNSRYKSMPFMGDTLDYSPMEIQMNVQEDLTNWKEIHDWMTGIGFPTTPQEFKDAVTEAQNEKTTAQRGSLSNPNALTSDATLTILSNKNNPLIRISFRNMYPTSLSGLSFDTKDTGAQTMTATVTLNYDLYTIEVL